VTKPRQFWSLLDVKIRGKFLPIVDFDFFLSSTHNDKFTRFDKFNDVISGCKMTSLNLSNCVNASFTARQNRQETYSF